MPQLTLVNREGTRAAQPTLNTKQAGTLYKVTDEGVVERWDGSAWSEWSPPAGLMPWSILILPTGQDAHTTVGTWGFNRVAGVTGNWPPVHGSSGTGSRSLVWHNSSAAQNDAVMYKVPLDAGTWDVRIMGAYYNSTGIVHVQFDGVEKGTVDTYSGSSNTPLDVSITGIVVPVAKVVEVNFKVQSKNASSSGYTVYLSGMSFTRTA